LKFPQILVCHMQRFVMDESWNAKKLVVDLKLESEYPQIDLQKFHHTGTPGPKERLLPDEEIQVNEDDVQYLLVMGFSRNRYIKFFLI
jgi:uncharacterized UBP type Zn finger protein